MDKSLNIVKMSIYSNFTNSFNAILLKISASYFVDTN